MYYKKLLTVIDKNLVITKYNVIIRILGGDIMTTFESLFGTAKFASSTERKKLQILFENYMSDLPANFYLNQFDLCKKYPGSSYEEWVKILTHPAFDSWKSSQIAIIATTQTDKALAGGEDLADKNALSLLKARQDVLKDEKKVEKPTIIVLPESLFFE